jgi:hypothetical protein
LQYGIPVYIFGQHSLDLQFSLFCDNTFTGKIRCKEITSVDKQKKNDCQSDIGCDMDVHKFFYHSHCFANQESRIHSSDD